MSAKKRGLGRGLSALLEQDEAGVRALPLGRLQPNRLQPRSDFDESGLEGLAESIRAQGVVQPIVVTPKGGGRYIIVAGERRWRAARQAGLEEVPVVVREVDGDRQLLEMALVENLQRSDLNPIEEGEAYKALQETFGLAHEEIGRQVGRGRSSISNSLRLLRLPAEVQDMLRDGRLTAGQARPLLGLASREDQLRLARQVAKEGLSARRVEALIAARGASRPGQRQQRRARLDPDTAAAAERLTRRLATKVEIMRRGKGGSVRLHFHSEDELMRLFDRLMQAGGKK
jgi:ParB family chromosome partitioning protein